MTIAECAETVEKIRAVPPRDFEAKHAAEDDLYRRVLESIADDPSNAQGLATCALRTQLIDFQRVCA